METYEKRFWAKVQKSDGCWTWTASRRSKGYGAFCYPVGGRMIQGRAHRFSYELHVGPIPPGLFVLHRCDNPPCVRPDHLFLGTNLDNIKDMLAKGRHVPGGTHCGAYEGDWPKGVDHHAAKLTEENVREIRKLRETTTMSYSELGSIFGINQSAAYKIVKHLLWRHVT